MTNFKAQYYLMRILDLNRRQINHSFPQFYLGLFLQLIAVSFRRCRYDAFISALMRFQMIPSAEHPRTLVASVQLIVRNVRFKVHFQIVRLAEHLEAHFALVRLVEGSFQLFVSRFRINDDFSGKLSLLYLVTVFPLAMRFQMITSFELLVTNITFERIYAYCHMGPHVQIKLVDRVKGLTAKLATYELFRILVVGCMRFEIINRIELLWAANAFETFLLRMDHHVPYEVVIVVETLRTYFAGEVLIALVSFFVHLHVGQIHKCFSAQFTAVRFLTAMDA